MAERFYPHLTDTGPPPNPHEVMDTYRAAFEKAQASGEIRPFILPYHIWGMTIMIAYLCIDHRKRPWLRHMRWLVLAWILRMQYKTLVECSSMSMAIAFATGLTGVWGMVWAFTWLVFKSPQWSAKRVQRRKLKPGQKSRALRPASPVRDDIGSPGPSNRVGSPDAEESPSGIGETDDSPSALENTEVSDRPNTSESTDSPSPAPTNGSALRQRKNLNGDSKKPDTNGNGKAHVISEAEEEEPKIHPGMNDGYEYYWEPYPDTIPKRISWLIDLVCNFRGPGWNWQIAVLPPLPAAIKAELGEPITPQSITLVSSIGLKAYTTRTQMIKNRWKNFVFGYFALDLLKLIMEKDPYYTFGPTTYALPWYLKDLHWTALRLVRQSISTWAIIISLEMVFMLMPIFLCLILGPAVLGLLGEPWYYSTSWGYWSNVMNKGLNGLWGSWWHQTFRMAFSAPTTYLIKKGYITPHTLTERAVALFFAFAISAILHTGGSISQFPFTFPPNAGIFFMLQGLGVLIQMTFCTLLRPWCRSFSKPIRQWGNFGWTFLWLIWTGYWLCDDFARGGMWLYEPVPISFFRGIWGGERDSWWCWDWDHIGVGLYKGRNYWWESGVSF